MIVIETKKITELSRGRFDALSFWPLIFIHPYYVGKSLETHERIHGEQAKELLVVGWWIAYLFFLAIRGYKKNPFEMEAYENQGRITYLDNRKRYAWRQKV